MPVLNISYHSSQRPQFDPYALIAMGPQISIDILPPSAVESWAKSHNVTVQTALNQMALLDTGASVIGVDDNVLANLQYPPIGIANLSSPSGISQTQVYAIRLVIPSRSDPRFPPDLPKNNYR